MIMTRQGKSLAIFVTAKFISVAVNFEVSLIQVAQTPAGEEIFLRASRTQFWFHSKFTPAMVNIGTDVANL